MKRFLLFLNLLVVLIFSFACRPDAVRPDAPIISTEKLPLAKIESPVIRAVLENAVEQTKTTTGYTQDYFVIPYPNGDVPAETGACTDVVIRAFRQAGVDLQREVHEDMRANFSLYPKKWSLPKPDTNIDHRRVPNLQTFFTRRGKSMPVSLQAVKYQPGDVVTWDIDGKGMTHIGLVSHLWNEAENRYLIIHNIGSGTRLDDVLFRWKVTGHFRYF